MTKKNNLLYAGIAALTVIALMIAIGAGFDYFLDLNDDILIKDITSGVYLGHPEGHNIQMLYPIGLFLSILYRLLPGANWYALFLAAVQYLCLGILFYGGLSALQIGTREKRARRIISFVLILCIFVTLSVPHLVILQYTFTCAAAAAAAAFLFLTTYRRGGWILGVVLTLIAFALRSEMLLLVLPLVVLALAYRIYMAWQGQKKEREADEAEGDIPSQQKFTGDVRTGAVAGVAIAVGLIVILGWNRVAYGSDAWQTFYRLFDNRTELYDFHEIPTYEEDQAFFEENGIGEAESYLLTNYNYALSERIDADLIGRAAQYMQEKEAAEGRNHGRFGKALSSCLYRLRHIAMPEGYAYPQTDAPWNLITILLYIAVLLLYMMPEDPEPDEDGTVALLSVSSMKSIVPKMAIFFATRSALWLFLLYRGRDPVRVTHGLYLVEIAILYAMMLNRIHMFLGIEISEATFAKMPQTQRRRGPDGKKLPVTYADIAKQKRWNWDSISKVRSFRMAMAFLLVMITISFLSVELLVTKDEIAHREEVNAPYEALFDYYEAHRTNAFLLMDVYTMVPYTQKAFAEVDNSYKGYDLLGGWAAKSPLQAEKFDRKPYREMLLDGDAFYVTGQTSLGAERGDRDNTLWLIDFLTETTDRAVTVEAVDTIADTFTVYRVK